MNKFKGILEGINYNTYFQDIQSQKNEPGENAPKNSKKVDTKGEGINNYDPSLKSKLGDDGINKAAGVDLTVKSVTENEELEEEDEDDCMCNNLEEVDAIDIDDLNESELSVLESIFQEYKSSVYKRTKKDKRKAAAGKKAIAMARRKKDALYKKYKKLREKAMAAKKRLMKKNYRKAYRQVRNS